MPTWLVITSCTVALTGGLFGILAAVWKIALPWLQREIAGPAQEARALAAETHKQVTVNGGRNNPPTLLDKVGSIGDKVDSLDVKVVQHLAWSSEETSRLWSAIRRLESR